MKEGEEVVFVFYELWPSRCLGASVSISWFFAFFAARGLHCPVEQKRNRRKWNAPFLGLAFHAAAEFFQREFEMIIQDDFSLQRTLEVNHGILVFNT